MKKLLRIVCVAALLAAAFACSSKKGLDPGGPFVPEIDLTGYTMFENAVCVYNGYSEARSTDNFELFLYTGDVDEDNKLTGDKDGKELQLCLYVEPEPVWGIPDNAQYTVREDVSQGRSIMKGYKTVKSSAGSILLTRKEYEEEEYKGKFANWGDLVTGGFAMVYRVAGEYVITADITVNDQLQKFAYRGKIDFKNNSDIPVITNLPEKVDLQEMEEANVTSRPDEAGKYTQYDITLYKMEFGVLQTVTISVLGPYESENPLVTKIFANLPEGTFPIKMTAGKPIRELGYSLPGAADIESWRPTGATYGAHEFIYYLGTSGSVTIKKSEQSDYYHVGNPYDIEFEYTDEVRGGSFKGKYSGDVHGKWLEEIEGEID